MLKRNRKLDVSKKHARRRYKLRIRKMEKDQLVIANKIKENFNLPIKLTQIQRRTATDRKCCKKSLISKINVTKNFACEHLNKPIIFCKNIIWNNKSKCEILNNNRRYYIQRKIKEDIKKDNVKMTVKHENSSMMIWGCFSARGLKNLVFINNRLTAFKCIDILKKYLFDPVKKMCFQKNFIFQQDNDPKYNPKTTMKFLKINNIQLPQWISQTPDLYSIEQLRVNLKRNLPENDRTNKNICIDSLKSKWNNMNIDIIKKLNRNIPNRLKVIINALR